LKLFFEFIVMFFADVYLGDFDLSLELTRNSLPFLVEFNACRTVGFEEVYQEGISSLDKYVPVLMV
jgi:hypothetical protein